MGASPDNWLQRIGKNIRDRRVGRGLTQEALSALMYVDVKTVKRHEKGQGLTLNMIPAYAAALDCSLMDLMFANVDISDPVFGLFARIKGYSDEEQKQIIGIIVQWLDMMEKNKAS